MIPQGQLQQQLNQAPSTPQRFPGSPMPRPAYQVMAYFKIYFYINQINFQLFN